jgi:hypothetical protein
VIEFTQDWQAYRAGQVADAATLGGGVVDVLTRRGIVRPAAQPAATTPQAPPAKPKPAKPKPAKARR